MVVAWLPFEEIDRSEKIVLVVIVEVAEGTSHNAKSILEWTHDYYQHHQGPLRWMSISTGQIPNLLASQTSSPLSISIRCIRPGPTGSPQGSSQKQASAAVSPAEEWVNQPPTPLSCCRFSRKSRDELHTLHIDNIDKTEITRGSACFSTKS